jgi:hypothetical protein
MISTLKELPRGISASAAVDSVACWVTAEASIMLATASADEARRYAPKSITAPANNAKPIATVLSLGLFIFTPSLKV